MTIWLIMTFALVVYLLVGIFNLNITYHFLVLKSHQTRHNRAAPLQFYLIIPLLFEQQKLSQILKDFEDLCRNTVRIRLVLITTEREEIELKKMNDTTPSTAQVILEKLKEACRRDQIFHFHFPHFNNTVATQLNYGIEQLKRYIPEAEYSDSILMFLNADTKYDTEVFSWLQYQPNILTSAFQVSSLFTKNIKATLKSFSFLAAAAAIDQSSWSLKHEIPRYIWSSNIYNLLGDSWLKNNLNYCVTHGLIMPMKIFDQVQGFPNLRHGGEDLAIGYVLRSLGFKIYPVPMLNNSDSPETIFSWWNQMNVWFLAVLNYFLLPFYVWKRYSSVTPVRLILLTLQGIKNASLWIAKGIFTIIYLYQIRNCQNHWSSYFLLAANMYLGMIGYFVINSKLSTLRFSRIPWYHTVCIAVFYPIIGIMRAFPLKALYWLSTTLTHKNFIKQKTK